MTGQLGEARECGWVHPATSPQIMKMNEFRNYHFNVEKHKVTSKASGFQSLPIKINRRVSTGQAHRSLKINGPIQVKLLDTKKDRKTQKTDGV